MSFPFRLAPSLCTGHTWALFSPDAAVKHCLVCACRWDALWLQRDQPAEPRCPVLRIISYVLVAINIFHLCDFAVNLPAWYVASDVCIQFLQHTVSGQAATLPSSVLPVAPEMDHFPQCLYLCAALGILQTALGAASGYRPATEIIKSWKYGNKVHGFSICIMLTTVPVIDDTSEIWLCFLYE